MSKKIADEMRTLGEKLIQQAAGLDSQRRWERSPLYWITDLIKVGTTIETGRRFNGTYDAYLAMPEDWRPNDHNKTLHWMYNSNGKPPHYWTSTHGETEKEALGKIFHKLIDILYEGGSNG